MGKRAFLIVLDSFGVGCLPDAAEYGDEGSNTIASCYSSGLMDVPNLKSMGIYNIDGVDCADAAKSPIGSYARAVELSRGKDTTVGHWEIAGHISNVALPTYPNGFPKEILDKFISATGRGVLCNMPYSGTKLLEDYGERHMQSGELLVYTSADSVFQIAAHEEVVPLEELYRYCEIAREILTGEHAVGRVIARPFIGEAGAFKRTANRKDLSLTPPKDTILDCVLKSGLDSISVGKIYDIFAGKGIGKSIKTKGNVHGMEETIKLAKGDFNGLCFVNLVDFDMMYGHRNDVKGYAEALNTFDKYLGEFMANMREDDILILTADHGCDPLFPGTDHTREYTPVVVYGKRVKHGVNLGTLNTFADIASAIAEYLEVDANLDGHSFLSKIV